MKTTSVKNPSSGQRIRHERIRRKMTQAELAKLIGTRQAYLCRIEGGHHRVGPRLAPRIMRVFGWKRLEQLYGKAHQ